MTGYYVEIGYNPCSVDYDGMWTTLKNEARNIADKPANIIDEARRLGAPETCDDGCCELDSYADNYAGPFGENGHPVSIIENGEHRRIAQYASSAGVIKYHVRRAYMRLLIEAMHKHAIEVNLTVA